MPQIEENKWNEIPKDSINTPAGSYHVRRLFECFISSQTANTTTRLLFPEIGKGFNVHNSKIAAHEAEIHNIELHTEDPKPWKREKVNPNPNKRFIQIMEAKEACRQLEDQLNSIQIAGSF